MVHARSIMQQMGQAVTKVNQRAVTSTGQQAAAGAGQGRGSVQTQGAANETACAVDVKVGKEVISDTIKFFENNLPHIFRDGEGHLIYTPANRQLLLDTANNITNLLGSDKYGKQWYAKILEDGSQVWVEVRNNLITNGGLNKTPKLYNPEKGLSRRI